MGEGPQLSQIQMAHGLAHSSEGGGLPGPQGGQHRVMDRRVGSAYVHLLFPIGLLLGSVRSVA